MAGGSLDGFPGVDNEECGSYSPSPHAADAELAAALAREYFTLPMKEELGYSPVPFTGQVEAILPHITRDVRGQPLLDGLVELIFTDGTDEEQTHCGGFLTAVVQALYDAGRNDLTLDLTAWQASPPFIGWFLHGTPERRLLLTYRGGAGQIGGDASYCDLIIEGDSTACGKFSSNVTFAVHGSVHDLGWDCADSLFAVSGKVFRAGAKATDCEFYLSEVPDWESIWGGSSVFLEFLQNGNAIYLPDEHGDKKRICLATHPAGICNITSSGRLCP